MLVGLGLPRCVDDPSPMVGVLGPGLIKNT
jgi:hypothetical protein